MKKDISVDDSQKAIFSVYIGNLSSEPIIYSLIKLYIDSRFFPLDGVVLPNWQVQANGTYLSLGADARIPVALLVRNLNPINHMPIFKESEWHFLGLYFDIAPVSNSYVFGYEIMAPGVDRRVYGLLKVDGFTLSAGSLAAAEMLQAVR